MDTDITNAIKVIHEAMQQNSTCLDEISRILIHLSPQLKGCLPVNSEEAIHDQSNHETQAVTEDILKVKNKSLTNTIQCVADSLANYYAAKIANGLSSMMTSDKFTSKSSGQLLPSNWRIIAEHLQKIQFFVGDKRAKEKLNVVLSQQMDYLLQLNLTYHTNTTPDFVLVEADFISVAKHAKVLIDITVYVLAQSQMFLETIHLVEFIQDSVLEKLTIELLTLTDVLKNSSKKQNVKSLFAQDVADERNRDLTTSVTPDVDKMIVPRDSLNAFSGIINAFIALKDYLSSSEMVHIIGCTNNSHKKGVLKHHSFDLPDLIQSSQHVNALHKNTFDFHKWHWYETLKDIVPLISVSIIHSIQEVTDSALKESKLKYKFSSYLEVVPSLSCIIDLSQPNGRCIKGVADILKQIIKLLPLAIAGACYKPLIKLHTDYMDEVNQSLKSVRGFLLTALEDVPDKWNPSNVPVILATVLDVVSVLKWGGEKMQYDGRLPFYETIQVFKSFCNYVQNFYVQYQKSVICTKLLHDAESHHWSDLRAFYEGDRCSYAIEMWHYFMCDMISDLRASLPCIVASNIIVDITYESITVFADRYSNCRPSSARCKQILQDTVSILTSVYVWMWEFSLNAVDICDVPAVDHTNSQHEKISKIFSACKDLFLCGILLSAPTHEVHFLTKVSLQTPHDFSTRWMSFINPTLFPVDWEGTFSSLKDSAAVVAMLKCMEGKSENCLSMVEFVLTVRKCFLLKQLVSGKILLDKVTLHSLQEIIIQAFANSTCILPDLLLECATCFHENSHALWTDLTFLDHDFSSTLLPWQKFLRNCIMPEVYNTLLPVVGFISCHTWSPVGRKIINSLPVRMKSTIPDVHGGDLDHLKHICLCMLLKALEIFALSITEPVLHFFSIVDTKSHQSEHTWKPQGGYYGCHFILSAARAALLDIHYWHNKFGIDDNSLLASELTDVATAVIGIDELRKALPEKYIVANTSLHEVLNEFRDTMKNIFELPFAESEHDLNLSDYREFLYNCNLNHNKQEQGSLQRLQELLASQCDLIASHMNVTFIPPFLKGE